MNLKTNSKTGISLVALVVTIVVLIIMSGAVILSFNKTNILDQAEYAAERQKVAFLQEKITSEKQNTLLEKLGPNKPTGTTQSNNITVQELLNVTEEDALNIVTANSIPANMPAGTYYELDENRYASRLRNDRTNLALLSRGVDRENDLVNDTYVVSENFTVYYLIDGKTGAPTQEIDDNRVIELLMNIMQTDGPTSPEAQNYTKELKEVLNIKNVESNNLFDITFTIFDVFDKNSEGYISETTVIYFYTIDRMYILNPDSFSLEYIDKEQKTTTYQYAKKTGQILTELESVFIGKTKTEMLEKYNNGTIDEYILTNCKSIKSVEPCWKNWQENEYVLIDEFSFEFNGVIYDKFCAYNTFYFIIDENGKCTNIYLTAGA